MIYKQGDVVIVPYPFTDSAIAKRRPALIVSANWYNREKAKYILCPITSAIPLNLDKDDFRIQGKDFEDAGLSQESIIRCGLLFTIDHKRIVKRLGAISRGTFEKVIPIISDAFVDR